MTASALPRFTLHAWPMRLIVALLAAILSLMALKPGHADEAPRRVALVIGNGAYTEVPQLPNPPTDAQAIGQALRDVGFTKVTVVTDLTHQGLYSALRTFSDDSANADWSVLYYAGHGIEVDGKNYLVPVDAHLAVDRDVEFEAVSMQTVLAAVGGARQLRLVILDACRDDPFLNKMKRSGGTRSISRGLTRSDPEGDLYVVYSAKSGQVARDGDGGRSPFVGALLKNIETPGLELNLLFRKVHADVEHATNGEQEPSFEGTLPDDELYFKAPAAQRAVIPAPASTPPPVVAAVTPPPSPPAAPIAPPPAKPAPEPVVTAKLEPPADAPAAQALSQPRTETILAVKEALRRVGCDAGPANGDWTIQARMALLTFGQKTNRTLNVDTPDADTLKALQAEHGLVCLPAVRNAPPSPPAPTQGASLEPEVRQKAPAPKAAPSHVVVQQTEHRAPPRPRPHPAAPEGGGRHCFEFNGERLCE